MKYSDHFALRDFLPVYDLMAETKDSWKSFIPTKQFCELLSKSLSAITSTDISKRKSMWVRGTFGTGKSHASSVVKHLLCDDMAEISAYLSDFTDASLREKVRAVRGNKRYFPVVLKGVEGAYDIPRFALSLQKETKKALAAAGHKDLFVKSDFETAINWIEKHEGMLNDVLSQNDSLRMIASTPAKIVDKLQQDDTDVFIALENALAEHKIHLNSEAETISDWLVEVEKEIENRKIADGLIIFWDEFTSVMDTIKSDRINVLQNIAEKSQQNNVFLFLISHRSEAQSNDSKGKDINKMSDRFESVEYRMDEVSTYLIMKHTFGLKEGITDIESTIFKFNRTEKLSGLLEYLCPAGGEEKEYMGMLFPMHPYTAYLCSVLSNLIGSANRSVIRFMNDETAGFKNFLEDPNACDDHQLLTAERLWDFFFDEFDGDIQSSIFTNVYRTEYPHVQEAGDDYVRVFKTILLLNALQTKYADKQAPERIAANEKNLEYLYLGDRVNEKLETILNFIDEHKIISRNIWGEFKISANSYNATELAEEKNKVLASYKVAVDYLNFFNVEKYAISNLFTVGEALIRKCDVQFYSCEDQESLIRSKLKKYMEDKPNNLHIAVFVAITEESKNLMTNRVRDLSIECKDSILIVADEVFTTDYKNKFIDLIATYNIAKRYFNENTASDCNNSARQYITKWSQRLINGTYELYFNGEVYKDGIIKECAKFINRKLSIKVFPNGMETVKKFQTVPMTFFKNKNYPALVTQILQAQTREQMTTFTGENVPTKFVFEENDVNLVREDCELTDSAKAGNSWLVDVCNFMDKCIEDAHKKYQDRFSLSEILAPFMRPPYGFFASKANWAALSYALRKHKGDLFQPSTSQPVSDEGLTDMLVILFKMWDEGRSEASNKLLLRFGSPEESKLTKQIAECFNLKDVVNINEIKSLGNARWGVQEFCKKKAHFPLWTLLYNDKMNENPQYPVVVKNIISLFEQEAPRIERIKELSNQIDSLKVELPAILKNPDNYNQGFMKFVSHIEKQDDIRIESEWWNDLLAEISNLPEEVAFIKESDIENAILKFYNRKKRPVVVERDDDKEDQKKDDKHKEPTVVVEVSEDTIDKAKERVKATNMPNMMWQQVMIELINEHPEISDFLAKYLA